jgi:hypothetical protein
MYHPFSIAETLSTAWGILRKNFITIIVYSVVTSFIIGILTLILGIFFSTQNFYIEMLVSLIIVFFNVYTTLGLYKLIFTLIDSEFYEFKISQIFPRFTMLISGVVVWFMFAALLVTYKYIIDAFDKFTAIQDISIIVGVCALLYLTLRCMFFLAFITDDDSGPIESVKQSFELTKGYFLKVLSILGVMILLIAVPAILAKYIIIAPLFIIFSYPFVNIFVMVAYRKLVYSHKDVEDLDSETI